MDMLFPFRSSLPGKPCHHSWSVRLSANPFTAAGAGPETHETFVPQQRDTKLKRGASRGSRPPHRNPANEPLSPHQAPIRNRTAPSSSPSRQPVQRIRDSHSHPTALAFPAATATTAPAASSPANSSSSAPRATISGHSI